MIDTAAILFSTLMVLFIVLRAVRLDRATTWFGRQDGHPGTSTPDGNAVRHSVHQSESRPRA